MTFIRLHDGTTLERQADGTYRPVQTMTDWTYLDSLSEDQIETMAATDPYHPALDDAFWEGADARASIRLEADILDFFQQSGGGYEMRINAVLREYVANRRRSSGA